MRRVVVILGTFLALPAVAGPPKVPENFCDPSLHVSQEVTSCEANGVFVGAAKDCLAALNRLEDEMGEKAKAIAQSGRRSQQGETATGKTEYDYAVESLRYLSGLVRLAKAEVNEYKVFLAPPSNAAYGVMESPSDPLAWAYRAPCFAEAQDGLDDVSDEMDRKLGVYTQRMTEANASRAHLARESNDYGSYGKAPLKAPRPVTRLPAARAGRSQAPASDITGIREDPEKRK